MISAELVVLLTAATIGLIAGRALRLPAIVAYLLTGVIAGPGVLGWVQHSSTIEHLAEIGVALLLFGVGIEFSLERLLRTLPRMLAGGTLQVGLTTLLTAIAFHWAGFPWPVAIFVGFFVSLSSTAVVMKIHAESGEVDAPQGQANAGILLFQDLALVPMMLLVPTLASTSGTGLLHSAAAIGRAVGAMVVLVALARFVLPRVLELVARARVPELFPITALIVAFGTALISIRLGLSLPLAAFLAGLALSGSRYAHPIFGELLPLRDAFVAVFFTSAGMLLEPASLAESPFVVAGLLGGVVLKGLLVAAIVGLLWRSRRLAILAGMGLAQIGELAFVLSREAASSGLISPALEQACLGSAIFSMAATPFLMRAARHAAWAGSDTPSGLETPEVRDHVLVIGFGTTGQAIARVLKETGIPFVAVDLFADPVNAAAREGLPVIFGDAGRRAVLERMGAPRARAAVVTVGDPAATRRIVSLLRQLTAHARILVRAARVAEIDELERLGASEVVPSEFETSIELFVRLLAHLGVPRHVIRIQESLIRTDHYRALRGSSSRFGSAPELQRLIGGGVLESARVLPGSAACGKTLAELDLRRRTGAIVVSVVHGDTPLPAPDGATRLEADDQIVLYGPHESIDRALAFVEPAPPSSGTPIDNS